MPRNGEPASDPDDVNLGEDVLNPDMENSVPSYVVVLIVLICKLTSIVAIAFK